jgi:hypothetical protein
MNILLNAVVVCLVLDGCSGWEVEHPPEDVPDAVGHPRVVGRPVPHREDVLLVPNESITITLLFKKCKINFVLKRN